MGTPVRGYWADLDPRERLLDDRQPGLLHEDFVQRMTEYGYTAKQLRLLSEWYLRVRKSQ